MRNRARVTTVRYDEMTKWIKHFGETGHEVLSVSVFSVGDELLVTILHK